MSLRHTLVLLGSLCTCALVITDARAQQAQACGSTVAPAEAGATNGQNPKKLRGLCMSVSSEEGLAVPMGRHVWKYQQRLLEAAGADPARDSEGEIARKIAAVWAANEETLICNNLQFDVTNGSLIKYAVSMKFEEFLLDMVHWGINLNRVDSSDRRTVLDYVRDHIERNRGSASEVVLPRYYETLRRGGAKHAAEL
jgi:hypothetical protein